jgi:hypothetical protein
VHEQGERIPQAPPAVRRGSTIVGMTDDIGRSLAVENHDLLVKGHRFPRSARDSDLLSFDRRHGCDDSRSVRKST